MEPSKLVQIIEECYDFVNKVIKEPAKYIGNGEKNIQLRQQNQVVYDMCLRTLNILEPIKVMHMEYALKEKSSK